MSPPSVNLDTTFERFLQELPVDYWPLAIEFKAFCRARKIKSPAQLLRVVLCYCGIDQVLRETAGTFTLLEERLSDTAIHKRLKACLPGVKALLERMMGAAAAPLIHGHLRFIMVDGSTIQGPGADGTWYRLPIAVDMVKLHLLHVTVTDKHQGEHLGYYPLHRRVTSWCWTGATTRRRCGSNERTRASAWWCAITRAQFECLRCGWEQD